MCARKRFLIWRIYTMTEQRFPAGSCTIRIQAERSCWSTPAFKLHFVAAGLKTFATVFVTDVCWYVGAQFQFQLDSTPWVFSDYHRKYFIELKSACLRWPWIFFFPLSFNKQFQLQFEVSSKYLITFSYNYRFLHASTFIRSLKSWMDVQETATLCDVFAQEDSPQRLTYRWSRRSERCKCSEPEIFQTSG